VTFESLARIPVTYTPCTGVTQDALGNDVPSFGSTVDLKAYSYAPHRNEDTDGHTSRDIAEVDLAMPPMTVDLMSRFGINGKTYEVVGERDETGGFHGWKPGIIVELKRVTG